VHCRGSLECRSCFIGLSGLGDFGIGFVGVGWVGVRFLKFRVVRLGIDWVRFKRFWIIGVSGFILIRVRIIRCGIIGI
jgi:hypothetical protein